MVSIDTKIYNENLQIFAIKLLLDFNQKSRVHSLIIETGNMIQLTRWRRADFLSQKIFRFEEIFHSIIPAFLLKISHRIFFLFPSLTVAQKASTGDAQTMQAW